MNIEEIETPPHWEALSDVESEVLVHLTKWGEQHHEDHTGDKTAFMFHNVRILADVLRRRNDINHSEDHDQWATILLEEVFEALSEEDNDKLYHELKQVAAVAVSWMTDIRSRNGTALHG